jgi:FKBP-type peptidyl-prolyl cis-trans isomerase
MRSLATACLAFAIAIDNSLVFALSIQGSAPSRRAFLSKATAVVAAGVGLGTSAPALAAPEIFTTSNGIKYATINPGKAKGSPLDKDIVAIEYTGYLTDGTIFGESDC